MDKKGTMFGGLNTKEKKEMINGLPSNHLKMHILAKNNR